MRGVWRAWPQRLAAAAIAAFAAAAHAVPLEVYGHLPARDQMTLSPDGEQLAYVQPFEDGRAIVVVSVHDFKPREVIRLDRQKLRSIAWADDARLLVVTSQTTIPHGLLGAEQEWYSLAVHDFARHTITAVPSQFYARKLGLVTTIAGTVSIRRIDGHTVLFVPGVYVDKVTHPALLRADLDTGEQTMPMQSTRSRVSWFVDAAGKVVARTTYDDATRRWDIDIDSGDGLRTVDTGLAAIDQPQVDGFGSDSGSLLVTAPAKEGWSRRSLSIEKGSYGPPPANLEPGEKPLMDRQGLHLVGGLSRQSERYRFEDPNMQAHWEAVVEEFGTGNVRLQTQSDGFGRIVFEVDNPKDGYAYYLMDTRKDELSRLGDVYEGLHQTFEDRRIEYTAADGLKLQGFLTLPRGREAKKMPLVVLVHGGPASHDTGDFYWWSQALAEQGYAVLRANFRGSDLNTGLTEAGYGEWGRKMQSDLSDGVRHLAKLGLVDPARVCIAGASYGGYAALAGVTLEPGMYRCAVSVAGPSDLGAMLKWVNAQQRRPDSFTQRYWERFMGASGPDDPRLDPVSPARHADRVEVPVLLIHGEDDTVVPYEQSRMMFDALRAAHKNVTFEKLRSEDHWLSRSETRLQMLQATVRFLLANDPPQ
jgi:cephalosporin-C deacetylase-like acetyl esterase